MATATETYRYARVRIKHFDIAVPAVAAGRTVYFPLRTLCKEIGIAPQMQISRVRKLNKQDPRWSGALRDLPIPTIKGLRDAACINKRHVGKWLDSIDPDLCSITAKGPLKRLQSELEAAADRFLFGDVSDSVYDSASKTAQLIIGTLSVGNCPRCGLALKVEFTENGAHLAPDVDEA